MISNSQYLEALLKNDTKVILAIYKNNFYKVKSFVLNNKGQEVDAEDVFQKALLQLAVRYKKEKFVINSSFDIYFFTVCKNLWRRELNKSKIKVTKDGVMELRDENEDIAMAILEQKRWELFSESLKLLSENCRLVLKLYFSKSSYSDIVEKLKYNSETVARQRVFKCKTKLKEIIKKDKRFKALHKL
ncbi:RNA polymerase sigma factor [Gaetbulibacter sp. NE]|uniref:RNA polymerase sigma factor n=1 Tax=Gaetbulibacter sp. NE TaxID=2982307 RepID=UPI0021D1871E